MVSPERFEEALENIETELDGRFAELKSEGKDIEAHRLQQRTQYDLEMLREVGHCTAVENYSMHFDGRTMASGLTVCSTSLPLQQNNSTGTPKNSLSSWMSRT